MAGDRVLVVDAGTSAMRALLVAADGSVTSVAAERWRTFTPPDGSMFARELDPVDVEAALSRLLEAAVPARESIAGVAVTGQREGLVFADDRGDALLISPNVDARASAEGMTIDAAHAACVYEVTGHLPSLLHAPAKLAWLRAHRPDAAARMRAVSPLADWLAERLSGEGACSRTLALENGLANVATGEIDHGLLSSLGFNPALVPPVVSEGSVVGQVWRGPMAGLPVALAGADTQCALAGAGVLRAGECGIVSGWSATVQFVTDEPVHDRRRRTWSGLHIVPGKWVLESNAGDCGRAWDWICGLFSVRPEQAEKLAATSPVGARDAVATLGPRVMRAARMSAGAGALTVPLPLVMTAPDRADVLRSVLEGVAFAIRANLEQIEEVAEASIPSVSLGGGMTRGALFTRILADVLGGPIRLAVSAETSALGAAAIASPALGLSATMEDAVGAMTAGGSVVEPHMGASAAYDDVYPRWCALADVLAAEGL